MPFNSFRDARTIETGAELAADVCVTGAGAAGITIARELIRAGVRVCLLEAGGLSIDPEVNALSITENVGRKYPPNWGRLRCFGGTTNHWGGHCVPLSPLDLEVRDWVEHSGWPYSYEELRPFYEAAHEVLGLGEFNYDSADGAARLGVRLLPFDGKRIETTMSRYNPVRFGLAYGDELNASRNLQCVLYADLSSIDLSDPDSETVTSVRVRSVARNEFTVKASYFIVACGGIENARILLCSNRQRPAGLGNHSDLVGRFFMEHILYENGYIVLNEPLSAYPHYVTPVDFEGIFARFHIAVPAEEQRQLRIPAFRAELHAISAAYWELGVGDVSALLMRPFEFGHALRCKENATPDALLLGNFVEQTPNPESRVTLSDTRDPLGRPNARLNWRLSALDHEGVVKAHDLISREVGRLGIGRMRVVIRDRYEIELEGAGGGAHHMGTTRMHQDPNKGVTDGHGLVHHTQNLYMAGSSLFPSCGYANPTLTIVATSLRLADTIKARLRRHRP
jgi:choline dehydrogenase-like flavoprotein